jgi:hypothetical protein
MASSGMLRRVALRRATRCNIGEDAIVHSHRHENLKFYKKKTIFKRTVPYRMSALNNIQIYCCKNLRTHKQCYS